MARTSESYRRWYLKLKGDPVRYAERLAIVRKWQAKYRRERSYKYMQLLLRKRVRRSLNPFPHRERNNAYNARIRTFYPDIYWKMLDDKRTYYQAIKANPEAYRTRCESRMIYQRYYRIVRKAQTERPL